MPSKKPSARLSI
jgi:hypothetical protein